MRAQNSCLLIDLGNIRIKRVWQGEATLWFLWKSGRELVIPSYFSVVSINICISFSTFLFACVFFLLNFLLFSAQLSTWGCSCVHSPENVACYRDCAKLACLLVLFKLADRKDSEGFEMKQVEVPSDMVYNRSYWIFLRLALKIRT